MARCRPIYTNTPTSPPINTLNTLNSSFDHPDHAPKMQTALRKSFASGSRMAAGRPSQHRAPKTLLRAASNESEQPAPAKGGSTVFYAGQSYTEAEWQEALTAGSVNLPSPAASPIAGAKAVSISDVMAFSGPGPEVINGRLSMLGFIAAVAAELSSGEGVLKQWSEEPTLIALTFVLFIAGSLVPMLRGAGEEKLGPFTAQAELLNGRAAMMGFAALIAIEAAKGSPLF